MATVTRETKETKVQLTLTKGEGRAQVSTTLPFLDHMLGTLARYAGLDLELKAAGDLPHHVAEDVAIALGAALKAVVPTTCARYGERTIPMDEALVHACLDLGGRFFYRGKLPMRRHEHVLRSLAEHAGLTLHVRVLRGTDKHHIVEAAYKAVGLSLRQALVEGDAVFSTKGTVKWEVR